MASKLVLTVSMKHFLKLVSNCVTHGDAWGCPGCAFTELDTITPEKKPIGYNAICNVIYPSNGLAYPNQ